MNKKDSKPKLGQDPLAWIKSTATDDETPSGQEPQPQQQLEAPTSEAETDKRKRRTGRPTTTRRKIEKTSHADLPENWTRATFIVQENLLADLKDLAYTERRTITDVINDAIEEYTTGKHIIRRERE